ncbi:MULTISPECIES: hypothetical protein [Priestia]|uniref:hypothetical protein n=1 Tax=Priestia TaxID=2800373 RepID=UPI001C8ECB4C|nr:hypothetical protein [Priestia aryabhattai]MBY0214869.1 hypothetical protein [Priestia aryabhattai]
MKKILYCPTGRAISAMVSTFGSGLLCSATITDITVDGKPDWSKLLTSGEFILTGLFFLLLLLYYIGMFKIDIVNDAALKNYQDRDLLVAMARKGQMKELVKWSKKKAKVGDFDQLHSMDKFLKGEYGNEQNTNDGSSEAKSPGTGKETNL